jgi:hypothetical protein
MWYCPKCIDTYTTVVGGSSTDHYLYEVGPIYIIEWMDSTDSDWDCYDKDGAQKAWNELQGG